MVIPRGNGRGLGSCVQCFWDLITEGLGMSGTGHLDFQCIAEVLVWSLPQVGALADVFRVSGTSSLKALE